MGITGHDRIRELLALAAAGALAAEEEKQVAAHLRSCIICSNELETWQSLASELRQVPAPQPSPWLMQTTLALAHAKFTEKAERDWNYRVVAASVAFSWLLTFASGMVFRFVTVRFGGFLEPPFSQIWIGFAVFSTFGWLAGAVAVVLLAIRRRGERRFV